MASLGEGLLREYHWNLAAAVSASYPEHKWHLWKFESVPRGYWASLDHRREVVEYVAAQLGFKSFEEWYKLSFAHFSSAGGSCYRFSPGFFVYRLVLPSYGCGWQLRVK
jgi:hypothetical protein